MRSLTGWWGNAGAVLVIGSVLALGGCASTRMGDDTMMKKDDATMKKNDTMMKKDEKGMMEKK